jgi:hypothetical protein
MYSQTATLIQVSNGCSSSLSSADHLDDLGHPQGFKDFVIGLSSAVSTLVAL